MVAPDFVLAAEDEDECIATLGADKDASDEDEDEGGGSATRSSWPPGATPTAPTAPTALGAAPAAAPAAACVDGADMPCSPRSPRQDFPLENVRDCYLTHTGLKK